MKKLVIALASALATGAAAPAGAQDYPPAQTYQAPPPGAVDQREGLDAFGGEPSPMCHESQGIFMPIHCLHNMLWHGDTYYGYEYKHQR